MNINTRYKVTIEIKLHTRPLRKITYEKVGALIKETSKYYIFEEFRVRKANVIEIREVVI